MRPPNTCSECCQNSLVGVRAGLGLDGVLECSLGLLFGKVRDRNLVYNRRTIKQYYFTKAKVLSWLDRCFCVSLDTPTFSEYLKSTLTCIDRCDDIVGERSMHK